MRQISGKRRGMGAQPPGMAIGAALAGGDYRFGAVVMDAVHFVPQSRPRLFIIGVQNGLKIPSHLVASAPDAIWHPPRLVSAYGKLSPRCKSAWVWWRMAAPPVRQSTFADVIEREPEGASWHTAAETKRLLGMMSAINREKVESAKTAGRLMIGGIYKRMRENENGKRVQRADIRGRAQPRPRDRSRRSSGARRAGSAPARRTPRAWPGAPRHVARRCGCSSPHDAIQKLWT
jgi:site-specific DNA-cytosine methylase